MRLVELWTGATLENTDIYGMRRYEHGARLLTHVDREVASQDLFSIILSYIQMILVIDNPANVLIKCPFLPVGDPRHFDDHQHRARRNQRAMAHRDIRFCWEAT